jgi:hypothetical protein
MISYYNLEDDEPPPPKVPVPQPVVRAAAPRKSNSIFDGETTECNYVVFIFVAGVLLLALADFMKNR